MPELYWTLFALPIGLGLLAFVEPCSVGASLLFIKTVEGKPASSRITQAGIFAFVRAGAIGALGALAALIGARFVAFQSVGGLLLAILYLALGGVYLAGKAGWFMRQWGPRLSKVSGTRSAVALGLLFALNIPACATPLLAALLGSAAFGTGGNAMQGFMMLSLFGLALSAPIVAAMFFPRARASLDRLMGLSRTMPRIIGSVLIALGAWTLYMSLAIEAPL
jgi:cytochrome c-type biogenesis protein